jgi:hypothetical protein
MQRLAGLSESDRSWSDLARSAFNRYTRFGGRKDNRLALMSGKFRRVE